MMVHQHWTWTCVDKTASKSLAFILRRSSPLSDDSCPSVGPSATPRKSHRKSRADNPDSRPLKESCRRASFAWAPRISLSSKSRRSAPSASTSQPRASTSRARAASTSFLLEIDDAESDWELLSHTDEIAFDTATSPNRSDETWSLYSQTETIIDQESQGDSCNISNTGFILRNDSDSRLGHRWSGETIAENLSEYDNRYSYPPSKSFSRYSQLIEATPLTTSSSSRSHRYSLPLPTPSPPSSRSVTPPTPTREEARARRRAEEKKLRERARAVMLKRKKVLAENELIGRGKTELEWMGLKAWQGSK